MPRHSEPITEVTVRGRTRYRVVLSTTKNGQRSRSVKTVDTYEEAKQAYAAHTLGESVPSSRDTFDVWADRWIARREDAGLRPKTVDGYRIDLLQPRAVFGRTRIQQITEDDVEALVRSMRDAGYAKRTVARMLITLRSVFRLALKKGVVRFNPAEDVEALGKPSAERDALTADELGRLRDAIRGTTHEAAWMLTLAGLRRSELLALRWSDVDFSAGTLAISRSRTPVTGEWPDTKTEKGRRVLPLDAERVALLKEYRAWQAGLFGLAQAKDGLIVVNEDGRPMRPESWSRRWRTLCRNTEGVADGHVLHAARHSTVTFMRNAGVPDHVVAAWHGHDEVIMRRTYSHTHAEQLKTASSALSFGSVGTG